MTRAEARIVKARELFSVCREYASITAQVDGFKYRTPSAVVPCVIAGVSLLLIPCFAGPGIGSLTCAGLAAGSTFYYTDMEKKRQVLRNNAGDAFQDDTWGFGQVLAVFVWVPFGMLVTVILFRVSMISHRIRENVTDDSMKGMSRLEEVHVADIDSVRAERTTSHISEAFPEVSKEDARKMYMQRMNTV